MPLRAGFLKETTGVLGKEKGLVRFRRLYSAFAAICWKMALLADDGHKPDVASCDIQYVV